MDTTDAEKKTARDNLGLADVAASGSYNDLTGCPAIPTVNDAVFTLQVNGSQLATFTANSATDVTANVVVPTKTSDITNDSGFITIDHNHDSRYYTESEIDTKLNGKAASDHTHGLTFSTSTGTPDYTLRDGDIIEVSAGGTTKKIQITPHYVNTLDDPFIQPDVAGSVWHNAKTGDLWIANGTTGVSDWILVNNRIHDLIVQRQSVVINGQGDARPILCDKQNYTLSPSGYYTYARVDPYELAKWKNRGDVIQVGGEVDYDPWGDGYPMRITEYQATKDANDKWYCTNLNLRGYNHGSTTESSYWGNINHDDETDKDFIEFQSWA